MEKSCACELNYILDPIYKKRKQNKKKHRIVKVEKKQQKRKTDTMWKRNVKLTGSLTGVMRVRMKEITSSDWL